MGDKHQGRRGHDHGRKTDFVMKIQCIQCKMAYDIDSALIAEGGTKVRCNRCKVIFWAFPDGRSSRVTPPLADPKGKQPPEPSGRAKDSLPDDIKGRKFKILISNSWLSRRARNVILRNVSSRNELVTLSPDRISQFRNCGKKTLHEILEFTREINTSAAWDGSTASAVDRPQSAKDENLGTESPTKRILRKAPTKDRLKALPLFSNKVIPGFSAADLHPGYKADLKISDVPFSIRAANVLENMDIKTLGNAMMTPSGLLLLQKNFGRTTLGEIQSRIRKAVLSTTRELSPYDVVSSGYDELITRFVRSSLKNKRNATILLKRLLPETDKLRTYDEIGEEYGITRERVRQIIGKGMTKIAFPTVRAKLASFFDKLQEIVRGGGGIIDIDSLASATRKAFDWQSPVRPKALALILEMNDEIQFDKYNKDWILVPDCECLTCEYPMTVLDGGLPEDTSTAVDVFAEQLASACKESCGQSETIERFHAAFVERLIEATDGQYLIKDDVIFPYGVWQTRRSNQLDKVIYRVLQAAGHPVHFTEAAQMVRDASEHYQNVSERYVHSVLISHPDIVLMGRGTYGLLEWDSPRDCTAPQAIQKLLKSAGLPLKIADIIDALKADYPEWEILAELKRNKEFVEIGVDYFDLKKRWEATSPGKLFERLNETSKAFAIYLITNNHCSYKLVLGIVLLEFMDKSGKIRKNILKEHFYDYYLQRYQAGLLVESENVKVSKIGKQKRASLENQVFKKALEIISNTEFIDFGDGVLSIDRQLLISLLKNQKERIKIILLKELENYYHKLT